MPTVLENYCNLRYEVEQRIAQGEPSASAVWWYGELVYRIGVLETCQMFCKTAPSSTCSCMLLWSVLQKIWRGSKTPMR